MPGLLQSPDKDLGWIKFGLALTAEFLGVFLFTFCGSVVPAGSSAQAGGSEISTGNFTANWAPWGNGITLGVLVYITANVSGGHLNPAVTLATIISGHIEFLRGIAYMVVQITGAIFGSLLVAGLVPGSYIGMGNSGTGCFNTGPGVNKGMLFGFECVMTFILVSTVFAVAIGQPSFPEVGPLAVGLALFSQVFIGSQFTGTALNPARVLGPASVFHCRWNLAWVYLIAEWLAGIIVGLTAGPLYGSGAPWVRKIVPWFPKDDDTGRGTLQKGNDKHDEMERQAGAREMAQSFRDGSAQNLWQDRQPNSAPMTSAERHGTVPNNNSRHPTAGQGPPETEMSKQGRPWAPTRRPTPEVQRHPKGARGGVRGGSAADRPVDAQGITPELMDSRILDSHSNLMHKNVPSDASAAPVTPAQERYSVV